MKFYMIFEALCSEKGKSPNAIAKELKIPSGSITAWKGGSAPRPATLSKISAYFGVTTDYLLGNTDVKNAPAAPEDSELMQNPDAREALIWFRDHSPEERKRALNILKALDIHPNTPKDK